ncbi:MAG: hypothetical protein KGL39_11535 [Patescibacteria group bacterium]|nr:hypothetical protein [Patescibacteria group bacterium]
MSAAVGQEMLEFPDRGTRARVRSRQRRAYRRGYQAGRAGNGASTAPYLVIALSADLHEAFERGHEAGLFDRMQER